MKSKKLVSLLLSLLTAVSFTALPRSTSIVNAATIDDVGVQYTAHVQNIGWQSPVKDGQEAGTDGKSLRVEALKIKLVNAPSNSHIEYQAHVQNIGWQAPVSDEQEVGTDGKSLRIEALKISLVNMPGYSVQYRVHVQNIGWMDWVSDGQQAGTDGRSLRVEALQIRIVKASENTSIGVQYQGHVQNIGWQTPVSDGQEAGTEGKSLRIEALKIGLLNAPTGAHVKYQTHVQNIGWQAPVQDNAEAGTSGKALRIEAIKISLENLSEYSIQYRAYVQNIGWQPWVSDGQEAGTNGKSLRVEAIEIKIVKKTGGTTPNIIPVSSINLNKTTSTLKIGSKDTLTTTITPSNATDSSIVWSSANTSVATVTDGVVTAVGIGNTIIKATSKDGSKSSICTVTVNNSGTFFGNTEGNIVNGGISVQQGDWIYYCQYDNTANYPGAPDNSAIYKMKSDGSNVTKLITTKAFNLNIKDDWIYYINMSESKMYKIKTDGSSNQKLSDTEVLYDMIIVGDLIYVKPPSGPITRFGLDGNFYDVFWGGGRDFVVADDTVYFTYMGDNESIWTTFPNNTKLNDEPSYKINVYGNHIYYINSQDNICSMNTSGGNSTILSSDKVQSLLVDNNWIYYSNKNDGYKLYKMKVDGTNKTMISAESIPEFNIVGDLVAYSSNGKTNFIKK